MKKLMIAAAIVCAAAVGQAASFYWGIDNKSIMGPNGEAYSDTDGYLLDGIAKLYVGDVLVATADHMNGDYTFGSINEQVIDTTGKVQTLPTGDISKSFEGQAYKIVLTTTDGAWTWETTGTSEFQSIAGKPGDPSENFERFVTIEGPTSSSDWSAVPEPTSGLLLLLGVAGLALRRRRA